MGAVIIICSNSQNPLYCMNTLEYRSASKIFLPLMESKLLYKMVGKGIIVEQISCECNQDHLLQRVLAAWIEHPRPLPISLHDKYIGNCVA